MPRATTKKAAPTPAVADVEPVLAADKPVIDETALLAQFASTLLRTSTGLYLSDEEGLRQRVRDAIGRARVMLDEFKIQLGA